MLIRICTRTTREMQKATRQPVSAHLLRGPTATRKPVRSLTRRRTDTVLEKVTSVPPRGAVSPLLLHQHPGVCILHMHSWIAGAGPAVGLRARLRDFSLHPSVCGSASTHREAPCLQSIILEGREEGGGI